MRSGTERKPNPCDAPLGRFLRATARPISAGYVQLRNGQIVREDTFERMKREAAARRAERAARKANSK